MGGESEVHVAGNEMNTSVNMGSTQLEKRGEQVNIRSFVLDVSGD